MATPVFPIERVLVPRLSPAVPVTFAAESRALTQGLPERFSLDAGASLVVVVPHGLATAWRDADPTAWWTSYPPDKAHVFAVDVLSAVYVKWDWGAGTYETISWAERGEVKSETHSYP